MESQKGLESLQVRTVTMSAHDLIDLVYKGESLPQDPRFKSASQGGPFKYFELSDLDINTESKIFSLVYQGEDLIGIGELEKCPDNESIYWIKFISVDPRFQNHGYGSKIAEELFKVAKEKNITLQASSYSVEGLKKMKEKLDELSRKYQVTFINTEKTIE
jgi:GNAT superfamily N-acetyltransferase